MPVVEESDLSFPKETETKKKISFSLGFIYLGNLGIRVKCAIGSYKCGKGRRINHTRELYQHTLSGYLKKQCIFFKLSN